MWSGVLYGMSCEYYAWSGENCARRFHISRNGVKKVSLTPSGFHDGWSWVGGCGKMHIESGECDLRSGGEARIAEGKPNAKTRYTGSVLKCGV